MPYLFISSVCSVLFFAAAPYTSVCCRNTFQVNDTQEYSLLLHFYCVCESLSKQTLESLLPKEHHSCSGQLPLCCSSSGDNLPVSSLSLSQMSTDANCCVPSVCTLAVLSARAHFTDLAYRHTPNSDFSASVFEPQIQQGVNVSNDLRVGV